MITSPNETKGCKVYVFVIGAILALIATGLLIYLCIYLTEYNANTNSITLQSMTNRTNYTSKHVTMATIAVNDKEIAEAAAIVTKISKIASAADSTTDITTDTSSDDDTTLVNAPVTTFTHVTLPSPPKPIKQITIIPENIVLQNVTPPHT